MPARAARKLGNLVLGWCVDNSENPSYWLPPGAKAGGQKKSDLVVVPANLVASHTIIVAQSGSGKSVFLGRLIEEILLNTEARCLVLDPNSDFRSMHQVAGPKLWKRAAYDAAQRRGMLPHERRKSEFSKPWLEIRKTITLGALPLKEEEPYKALRLWWPALSVDVIAEDADPRFRNELYHCHSFVKALAGLVHLKSMVTGETLDLIDTAESICQAEVGRDASLDPSSPEEARRSRLKTTFDVPGLLERLEDDGDSARLAVAGAVSRLMTLSSFMRRFARRRYERLDTQATAALGYFSDEAVRFYFGKAREFKTLGILADEVAPGLENDIRLHVLDLPSLSDESARLVAVNATLTAYWDRAREEWSRAIQSPASEDERVPTFIVLDEAHYFIPAKPLSKMATVVRDQFRMIAAEGRKYGLFLVIASQRPDKLDPHLLSECDNKAVMRLDSEAVLSLTVRNLGLEAVPKRLLAKTLDFGIGRALLVGRWMPEGPRIMYGAARRTVEGGRNLREKHWAVPPSSPKPGHRKKPRKSSAKQTGAK